jgi:hypothetical protein
MVVRLVDTFLLVLSSATLRGVVHNYKHLATDRTPFDNDPNPSSSDSSIVPVRAFDESVRPCLASADGVVLSAKSLSQVLSATPQIVYGSFFRVYRLPTVNRYPSLFSTATHIVGILLSMLAELLSSAGLHKLLTQAKIANDHLIPSADSIALLPLQNLL